MTQPFDKFLDCGFVPTDPNAAVSVPVSPNWIAAAIELVVAIADAYSSIRDSTGKSYDEMFHDISEKLGKIEEHLSEIDRTLAEIRLSIVLLPDLVKGAITSNSVDVALGLAASAAERIQYYMAEGTFEQHIDGVIRDLDNIHDQIGVVNRLLKGGLATVIVTSPLIAVWLSGAVALEKFYRKRTEEDPIKFPRVPESPWSHPVMTKAASNMAAGLQDCKDQEAEYLTSDIPFLPYHNEQYRLSGIKFHKSNYDGDIHQPFPPTLPLKIPCPASPETPEKFEVFVRKFNGPFVWKEVTIGELLSPTYNNQFSEGATVVAAIQHFKKLRSEILKFYEVIPDILAKEKEIMDSFIEPPGF